MSKQDPTEHREIVDVRRNVGNEAFAKARVVGQVDEITVTLAGK
jgi:hypothetical protein